MTYRALLRAEGLSAVAFGTVLYALGTGQGRQGHLDALVGGMIMLLMTGAFMKFKRGIAWRDLGGWFTLPSLASAAPQPEPAATAAPGALRERALVSAPALAGLTVALSHLTGYWLTYMDLGVWLVLTGLIRIGPARTAVAKRETQPGLTYVVLTKPLIGAVEVVARTNPQRRPLH